MNDQHDMERIEEGQRGPPALRAKRRMKKRVATLGILLSALAFLLPQPFAMAAGVASAAISYWLYTRI